MTSDGLGPKEAYDLKMYIAKMMSAIMAANCLEALRDLFYRRKFHSNLALYLDLGGVVHSCNAVRTNTHKTIFKRGNGISLLDK